MRRFVTTFVALAAVVTAASAQETGITPEIRPFVGAYIPTGAQRDLFKNAAMFGVQAAIEVAPTLHLLGTFGYVPGQTKYAVVKDKAQMFSYDVGAEFGMVNQLDESWQLKPFIGAGAGARTYTYQSDQLRNKTCTAGYGAAGSELQVANVALRLEARDNVFCFKSPVQGQDSRTRNDVALSFGLAYHFR